jgi:hypothetical protein
MVAARHAADIVFKLDNLKRSIDDCHPQVPSLAVETALLIERHTSAENIDEVFAEKSFEELNDATRLFEQICTCKEMVTPMRKVKQTA